MKINTSRNQAFFSPSHESVLCFFFFFFLNIDGIGYMLFLGDVFFKSVFIFEVEPVCSLPAALACILLYILRGWIDVAGPPARTVIAQACCSGRSLSRGSQAENLCAIPMPPLKSTRQSQHHHLLLHHAVIWPHQWDQPPGSCSAPSAPLATRGQPATGTQRKRLHWQLNTLLNGCSLIHSWERQGVPMTTRHPLRCVSLTPMTNFPALEAQVLLERQHCADTPNKFEGEIAVTIITGWSFVVVCFCCF